MEEDKKGSILQIIDISLAMYVRADVFFIMRLSSNHLLFSLD